MPLRVSLPPRYQSASLKRSELLPVPVPPLDQLAVERYGVSGGGAAAPDVTEHDSSLEPRRGPVLFAQEEGEGRAALAAVEWVPGAHTVRPGETGAAEEDLPQPGRHRPAA